MTRRKSKFVQRAKPIRVAEHNRNFMWQYRQAMQQWYDDHQVNGKSPPPPVYKLENGQYFWATRKQRKLIEQGKLKAERVEFKSEK